MTIDLFSIDSEVRFSVIDYVYGLLDKLPEDVLGGKSITPALKYLFLKNVNVSYKQLDSEIAETSFITTACPS